MERSSRSAKTAKTAKAPETGDVTMADVVTAGGNHSCAVLNDGTVRCWGANGSFEAGTTTTGPITSPVTVGLSGGALAVTASAGFHHTCVVAQGGAVQCWGDNSNGQRGWGTSAASASPGAISGISNAVSVACGDAHTCALLASGEVWCWGLFAPGVGAASPTKVSGTTTFRTLAAGGSHSCGIATNGDLYCWGGNGSGQLGDGTTTNRTTATLVTTTALRGTVIALDGGVSHTCAITVGGGVFCWGNNSDGQLGIGSTTSASSPTAVTLSSGAGTAAALLPRGGFQHTCVVTDKGPQCWGANYIGQLGFSATDTTDKLSPVVVTPPGYWSGGFFSIYLGYGTVYRGHQLDTGGCFACAVSAAYPVSGFGAPVRGVKCWGQNSAGQLGDGTTSDRATPVWVNGLDATVVAVATGSEHACALLSNGQVSCWGGNAYGQVGDNTTMRRTTPVTVLTGSTPPTPFDKVVAITAGQYHTCALRADGSVWCWGANSNGQLGDGSVANKSTPVRVTMTGGNFTDATEVSAGYSHTCAVRGDGTIWCWGARDSGSLGILGTGAQTSAIQANQSSGVNVNFTSVSGGQFHSCGLRADGNVYCWGDNSKSQLGITGSSYSGSVFRQVSVSAAAGVHVGGTRSCALRRGGTAQCWGDNTSMSLGNEGEGAPFTSTLTTVRLSSGTTAPFLYTDLGQLAAISTDCAFGCALRPDGKVFCWGANDHGQMGNGTISSPPQTGARAVTGL
jgi:alpha-tubulin suppressor-like RCC1 family protein